MAQAALRKPERDSLPPNPPPAFHVGEGEGWESGVRKPERDCLLPKPPPACVGKAGKRGLLVRTTTWGLLPGCSAHPPNHPINLPTARLADSLTQSLGAHHNLSHRHPQHVADVLLVLVRALQQYNDRKRRWRSGGLSGWRRLTALATGAWWVRLT